MKKRSQIAMEYILILTIALIILVPGIYLFRNYALESNDRIIQRRLADISTQLLAKARKIYFYGPPSKSVVTVEVPPQVEKMFVVINPNDYNLGFVILTSDGRTETLFESDIQLRAAETESCAGAGNACTGNICECFPERFYSRGVKNFRVTASEDCLAGESSCIIIDME